jgi:2'-hydroxyisoflavone reductase
MGTNRRTFLKTSALAGGALSLGITPSAGAAQSAAGATRPSGAAARVGRAPKPLNILILGGTGFTGPHQVRYAIARGHKVTVFNRGRRQADLPKEVVALRGDRSTGDLESLKGKKWDVVIDNPTSLPKWVRDAAAVLKGNTNQYVFISTISVYADTSQAGMDETTRLNTTNEPDATQVTGENYGALKALSEQEAERAFPGRATIIRPGLIVGPGDPTDRFTYWPVRIDRGGEVLAPGDGTDPVQFIDARDLAEWTIRMVEQGDTGVYNATGPRSELTMAEMLYGIRAVTPAPVSFTWASTEFLQQQNVSPWGDMPVWVPGQGDSAGFARVSIQRALDKGLTFRTLATTAADTLAWHKTRPAAQQEKLRAGIAPEREREVLAAWKATQKPKP